MADTENTDMQVNSSTGPINTSSDPLHLTQDEYVAVVAIMGGPFVFTGRFHPDDNKEVGVIDFIDATTAEEKAKTKQSLDGYRNGSIKVPVIIPKVISKRQFVQALADTSIALIQKSEAIDWMANNKLPTTFQTAINNIQDDNVRFKTEMAILGAKDFYRYDETTLTLKVALNKSDTDLDAIWILGDTL